MNINGQYGALYVGTKQIGGLFFWCKEVKPKPLYWTNEWWLFEEIKECDIVLYEEVNGELKQVQQKERVRLKCTHKIKLDIINKGLVQFEVI